jgi:UDP-N-acetylmuramoylalanine--D-glutamate ligase
MERLDGKKVLVIGFGESGYGAALLLRELGANVKVTDIHCNAEALKKAALLSPEGVELELGTHSRNFCKNVDFAIVSPGVPQDALPLVWLKEDKIPVLGEFEWASRYLNGKVIAVTGSNGKSTTVTLIRDILRENGFAVSLAGNIGRSLSRAVVEEGGKECWWVLEVSSFQLERVEKFKPLIAVLLNLTPNHLDHYERSEDYIRAKLNLFKNQGPGDIAILNRMIDSYAPARSKTWYVNGYQDEDKGMFMRDEWIWAALEKSPQKVISLKEIPFPGGHFQENVMFAAAAALEAGVSCDAIQSAVKKFKGLPHRQEVLGLRDGVTWINDSKSTSVDAVRSALEAFKAPIVWIAGGHYKGGEFDVLRDLVAEKVKSAHFYGEAASILSKALKGVCPIYTYGPLAKAVEEVKNQIRSGDTVVFSPGCSSFDQFKNFEERGEFFRSTVAKVLSLEMAVN